RGGVAPRGGGVRRRAGRQGEVEAVPGPPPGHGRKAAVGDERGGRLGGPRHRLRRQVAVGQGRGGRRGEAVAGAARVAVGGGGDRHVERVVAVGAGEDRAAFAERDGDRRGLPALR